MMVHFKNYSKGYNNYRSNISQNIVLLLMYYTKPVLMADWPTALQLVSHCLSPLSAYRFRPVNCGWAMVFVGYSGFLHQFQLASHYLAAIKKRRYNEIPTTIPSVSNHLTRPALNWFIVNLRFGRYAQTKGAK